TAAPRSASCALSLHDALPIYALSRWLARLPDVARVDSVVDLDPRITPEQYRQMAAAPREMLPPPLREAFERMVGPRVTMLVAQTDRKSTRLNSSHVSISYAVF